MQNYIILTIINIDFINNVFQMTKKQDALNKAKESWKEIVKWWKELGTWTIQVLWWTAWALGYTLLSAWEKWVEKVSNVKWDKEWITKEKRKKYRDRAKKYSKRSEEHIVEAWNSGENAIKWAWKALKWWARIAWHSLKWGYHLIDAWDKAIWEQIEKKQLKKWKKAWKISSFFRDNILKLLIAAWATGYWGYKVSEAVKDTPQDKQEILINDKTESDKDVATYKLTFDENQYFQNPEFFDKNFKVKKDSTYADKWVILIRDAWMTFYVVQDKEYTKKEIRDKLASIPEFSYLKDSVYNDKIKGFNVPDTCLKKWLYIPIPVKTVDKKVSINKFKEYSKIALHEMENDAYYWEKIKEIIKKCWEKQIINIMTAFARCETATDQEKFSDPIWTTELHRWEPWSKKRPIKAFSFSYYHILMEKNADGKTPWPWLKVRQKLWLTEWQCYHPINAWKLFLWYCFEKVKDPTYFFKIRNLEEAKIKWWKYNWDSSYWQKLWDNIQYISKK